MRTRALLLASSLYALACATPAQAAPCAGFSDVDSTEAFCPNVEWLKNRKVTLGCTESTYCPGQAVTRLSMALFMNRLAIVLTPTDLPPSTAAATTLDLSAERVICPTPAYLTADYPRRAYASGTVNISTPTGSLDVQADVVVSTNGGPWQMLNASDQYASLYTGSSPVSSTTLMPYGIVDLEVGQSVVFALRVTRIVGAGNVTAACRTNVQVANRNGTGPVLDAPAAANAAAPAVRSSFTADGTGR